MSNYNNMSSNVNNNKRNSLLETTVDLEPAGVIYNISKSTIENFVKNYLTQTKNIDGVKAVCAVATKKPQPGYVIDVYAFFDSNSKDIIPKAGMKTTRSFLTEQMSMSSYRTSDNLQRALGKIARNTNLMTISKERNSDLACRLDTYKILCLMLLVDQYNQELDIWEVKPIGGKGDFLTTVFKLETMPKNMGKNGDKYSNWIAHLR